jgi:hypothetical protein
MVTQSDNGNSSPPQLGHVLRPRRVVLGRCCAAARSFTLETSSIPPAVCRRWGGTSRTAMIHHVRRPTATWADTCSPATVTLMDTAASLVCARAALTHTQVGRPAMSQPHCARGRRINPTSHWRDSASCRARLALRRLLPLACQRPSVLVGPRQRAGNLATTARARSRSSPPRSC